MIALDTSNGTLVVAGDIQGFSRSEDYGDHWRIVNRRLYPDFWHRVACVACSATETNTVYACVGDASTTSDSGFWFRLMAAKHGRFDRARFTLPATMLQAPCRQIIRVLLETS
ncbi:hypothetical protein TM7_0017 [candidate division TM7 genomosp. GTL1]|nr:hypothetical protein TM7_0017 [candidate division TM7 genomosp. GTL1]